MVRGFSYERTRHYAARRIDNWLRITVNTPEEMAGFLSETERILR